MAAPIALLFIAALLGAFIFAVLRSGKKLEKAPVGSVRVETTPADRINTMIAQYQAYGWVVVSQSSAKSFGTQAKVTVTFRKVEQVHLRGLREK